jgi:hypothetical protein
MKTLYSSTVTSSFFGKHFAREVGPYGVRPRASAAGPYAFGCGAAALCILFLTMIWAALTHEAVPCPLPWGEGVSRHPDALHRDAGRVRGRSGAASQKTNLPEQLPNNRQRSLPGNAMNLRQPGLDKSSGAAKGGLIPNETVHDALPVRMLSVVRPTVPLPNDARHRSPNPAVVSGSLNSHSHNTAAINGTRINRRPNGM